MNYYVVEFAWQGSASIVAPFISIKLEGVLARNPEDAVDQARARVAVFPQNLKLILIREM